MKIWFIYHRLLWYPSTCMHVLTWKSYPIHWEDLYFLGDHQLCELGGDTKGFECTVFFGIFGHRLMLQVEGRASKMCEVVQCWDNPRRGAQKFMKTTWLDKMHAFARARGTNSIFTSTTNNVLKGEGNQWRSPYVNSMRWTIVVICFSYFQANCIGYNHWSDEATYGWQYIFASKIVQWNAKFEIGQVVKPRTLYIKGKERESIMEVDLHCSFLDVGRLHRTRMLAHLIWYLVWYGILGHYGNFSLQKITYVDEWNRIDN